MKNQSSRRNQLVDVSKERYYILDYRDLTEPRVLKFSFESRSRAKRYLKNEYPYDNTYLCVISGKKLSSYEVKYVNNMGSKVNSPSIYNCPERIKNSPFRRKKFTRKVRQWRKKGGLIDDEGYYIGNK